MNQPKSNPTSHYSSQHSSADQADYMGNDDSLSSNLSAPNQASKPSKHPKTLNSPKAPKASSSSDSPLRVSQDAAISVIRPEMSAVTHYLAHESTLLDLIAIAIYQHLIEAYGAELDQEMTSDTILTTLKNWAAEQCDRYNLWTDTAEDIRSTLVSQALQAMQRDLGDRVLESLDWEEFNQILFQYMFEAPTMNLRERLKPMEESYAQRLAQRIIQEMDLANQSLSLLRRRLGLTEQQESQATPQVEQSLSNVSPIAELASELPLSVQEGEDGTISFSDQFQSDLWSSDAREVAYLRYHAKQNRHQYLEHYITSSRDIKALPWELVEQIRLKFGLSAAKLQFLLAAYATQYPRWDQPFTLTSANLVEALGWSSSRTISGHAAKMGNFTNDQDVETKAINLLYALSCVLVKLVWVDYKGQDSSELKSAANIPPQESISDDAEPPSQSIGPLMGKLNTQAMGRSPVGKLWDVMITPQGLFDRQSGEIETTGTVLLTVRPGLWVELLDGGYNPPVPSMDVAFTDDSNQSLNQFGTIALHLLQLDAYGHELTIRLVIYLMLDAVCRAEDVKTPAYNIQILLERVMPDAIAKAQSDIKQGQKLFEDWNITLEILAKLIHGAGFQPAEKRGRAKDPEPTDLYVSPYPKWLNPETYIRKPRGWVQVWLSQKIQLQLIR
ncbi:MAG: hypothetical protein AAGD25_04565 [Cyanobacteria bacterium P01_F01_bin.150]